jgi:hypothetical protein
MPEWVLTARTVGEQRDAMQWALDNGYSKLEYLAARREARQAKAGR